MFCVSGVSFLFSQICCEDFFLISLSPVRLLDNVIFYFLFTGECSLAYLMLFTLSVFYLASNHGYELLKDKHYSR